MYDIVRRGTAEIQSNCAEEALNSHLLAVVLACTDTASTGVPVAVSLEGFRPQASLSLVIASVALWGFCGA